MRPRQSAAKSERKSPPNKTSPQQRQKQLATFRTYSKATAKPIGPPCPPIPELLGSKADWLDGGGNPESLIGNSGHRQERTILLRHRVPRLWWKGRTSASFLHPDQRPWWQRAFQRLQGAISFSKRAPSAQKTSISSDLIKSSTTSTYAQRIRLKPASLRADRPALTNTQASPIRSPPNTSRLGIQILPRTKAMTVGAIDRLVHTRGILEMNARKLPSTVPPPPIKRAQAEAPATNHHRQQTKERT